MAFRDWIEDKRSALRRISFQHERRGELSIS